MGLRYKNPVKASLKRFSFCRMKLNMKRSKARRFGRATNMCVALPNLRVVDRFIFSFEMFL